MYLGHEKMFIIGSTYSNSCFEAAISVGSQVMYYIYNTANKISPSKWYNYLDNTYESDLPKLRKII